jgi:hypothetical protein
MLAQLRNGYPARMSPREPRAPNQRRLEGPPTGARPLLQGHLRKQRAGSPIGPDPVEAPPSPEPAAPEAKGKRTRGKDETATREHLEGAEQGPM